MIAAAMASKHEQPARHTRRSFYAVCALLCTALVCTVVVLASPRPVEPGDLPALYLNAAQAEQQVGQDRELASKAPRGELPERLFTLFREHGLDELAPHSAAAMTARRREELERAAVALRTRFGEAGLDAARAALLEQAMRALRGELATPEAQSLLGAFPIHLARNGFVERDGTLRAPELALRALYKARFNLLTARAREASLSRVERQALDGYIALHAHRVPSPERVRAARDYYEAGGAHGAEALAVWLFASRASTAAHQLLARSDGASSLRVRNLQLFIERHP